MENHNDSFYVEMSLGHDEVTGSSFRLDTNLGKGKKVVGVVDCGMFLEKKYEERNREMVLDYNGVDYAVITHAHNDHSGNLPIFIKQNISKLIRIYATYDTKEILRVAIEDNFKIMEKNAQKQNIEPLYKVEDILKVVDKLTPKNYNETFNAADNVKVTFYRNGHIPGAAVVYIKIKSRCKNKDDINLIFTGDYAPSSKFFNVPELPEYLLEKPVTIISESTYGNTKRNELESVFADNILKWLENEHGTVFIPVLSLDRGQTILHLIKQLQKEAKLDTNIPIYVDGKLFKAYNELYQDGILDIYKHMQDIYPENVTQVDKRGRQPIIECSGKKIIISSSGMGNFGPSNMYIKNLVTNPNVLIHFTCYTPEGTLGRKLKETEKGQAVEISGKPYVRRAEVFSTSEFTKHAMADEMFEFLNKFKDIRCLAVNHGENEAQEKFIAYQKARGLKAKDIIRIDSNHQYVFSTYGLIKVKNKPKLKKDYNPSRINKNYE